MKAELEEEGERDGEVFDKMDCWCDTNGKAKQKTIADADQRVMDLKASIEEFTAKGAQLRTEIDALSKEISQGEGGLKTATSIREKESAEYQDQQNEATVTITALQDAVTILGRQQALPQEMMLQVQQDLKQFSRHAASWREQKRMTSFLQQQNKVGASLLARAPSDQILGVLKGMK